MPMIACDGCGFWLHLVCVGLDDDSLNSRSKFYCPNCQKKQIKPKPKVPKVAKREDVTRERRESEDGGIGPPTVVRQRSAGSNTKNAKAKATKPRNIELTDQIEYLRETIGCLKVHMHPCITEEKVSAFEEEKGIKLPPSYRFFLLRVGNGGAGPPKEGMAKLGEVPDRLKGWELSKPFPFSPDEIPAAKEMYLGQPMVCTMAPIPGDSRGIGETEQTLAKRFQEEPRGGLLWLGTDGAGDDHCLVINGPDKGKMWMIAEDFFGPQEVDFINWFARWLDKAKGGEDLMNGTSVKQEPSPHKPDA